MKIKISAFLQNLFFYLYVLTAATVFAIVLFLHDGMEYAGKINLPLPTWLLLLAAAVFALLVSAFVQKFRTGLEERFSRLNPAAFFVLLFLAHLYICYNCYFETGWDVDKLMPYSFRLADGYLVDEHRLYYFQRFPNNALITWLFSLFIRVSRYVGVLDVEQSPYMAIITVQCALASLTGYLVYRAAFHFWKTRRAAWLAAFFYCALVGLSPWAMIPYSDAMGLAIPMLVLSVYISMGNRRRLPLKWAAMGFLAYLGYRIKPQCAICVIAVGIIEAAELLKEERFWLGLRRRAASLLAMAVVFVMCAFAFSQILLPSMAITPDKEMEFGPTHFFMMGLNNASDGSFYGVDSDFSAKIDTAAERSRRNMEVAMQRIADYGPQGLLLHTAKKTLVNFGDGTFAWGREGNFYKMVFEPKNRFISPLLRNLYYNTGAYYSLFAVFEQAVWLFTLFAPLGLLFAKRGKTDKVTLALMLSILGLTMFETLFEARARCLYTYAPYFVLLACAGWKNSWSRLCTLRLRTGKPKPVESR